ncbi:unnamed protein product [Nippostrongylus brasiliensis]|uniref:Organic solute transporter alpha-like protein 1 (inferred by orthology to a C. elegans protein) n=1 Tax=Nippostrongylus brasiliensis TaxID=27835 RepID=A0A0N4Y8B5_NIPBR|nr:unnamed protein product [Nippostrongylus brasiliensis]
MEIVKTFIVNPRHDTNTSYDDREIIEAKIWITEIDSLYVGFLTLASLFTTVVVCLAVVQLYYVYKYVSNCRIQGDLYYLALMFPITTICNVVGMFIPRAAPFLYAVALVRNLQRVEWLVFQTPILRTAFELTSVVVFMELGHRNNLWFMFAQLFGLISMCVAFYGCYVIVPLGKSKIEPYRFSTLFTIVDVAQCLYTIQKFCFDFAAVFDIITPDHLLTTGAKTQFWASFMLTWEMMTLSAIATYTLRPSQSIFFDKYPIVDSTAAKTGSTHTIESFVTPELRIEPEDKVIFDPIVGDAFRIPHCFDPEV